MGAKAQSDAAVLPRIFMVNWFRKDENGKFVWPGFGENSRVLKWIVERIEGEADAVETPIGHLPTADALDVAALDLSSAAIDTLLSVDTAVWTEEAARNRAFLEEFDAPIPPALMRQQQALEERLANA
jgi:phosphoenolpyruvate carboxykinase (GTP)